jgi:5-formyltetrahydrofolate cyclo-ligase
MMDVKKEKSEFRKEMLSRRTALTTKERAEANRRIFQSFSSLAEYDNAATIFSYVSVADEPDTTALIEDAWKRGKRVCVPRCASMGIMHAYGIRSMNDLQKGKYGIPEPQKGCPPVLASEIDLIIVPCVCCSVEGFRLGYGGGFYDRWLENRSAPAVLLCFEKMLVPTVPLESHDQRVNILVSDSSTHLISGF